ncbi:MAG: radical SAM protein [Nanoarchaeota archaeon]|nr:radical SAM protein [Nanoarchaeota archaeon]MBU1135590.1 radical SAM protein [Nanoarchaeota archaeon]
MELSKEKYFGLGSVPIGIGALIKGWNIEESHFCNPETLSVVDFRAMTASCMHDCFHCFTDKLKKTITLEEIKSVIDQLAEMGAKSIDFLGEGEPTLDKDFFEIIEYTVSRGIQPVIFTDAATKMRDREFVRKVKKTGASVVPKCDSLWNPEYQNWVVGDKTGKYFEQRNDALKILMEEGFNEIEKDGTTRLGFDMVISKKNMHEVEKTLRFCRENNLWIVFAFYIPAGRCAKDNFDKSLMLTEEERKELRKTIKHVDEEYGYVHPIYNNFGTLPCVEFIQIYGDGRVSPCPGNETIMGNIKTHTLKELRQKILEKFPKHNPEIFDGHCLYRSRI